MPIRPENRDRYPKDWPEISRRIRFERAQGRCECEGECLRGTHLDRCPNVNGRPAYGTGSRVVLIDDVDVPSYPRAEIARLRGHDLACWCPLDQPCHADVLLELANG